MEQQTHTEVRAAERIAGVVLAAGLGERMRPLTSSVPKPLLTVCGLTVLDLVADKLLRSGCIEIHCNLFHLAERIERHAAGMNRPVVFHREGELLGVGGGIANMSADLAGYDTVLVHNGDIVSSIEFGPALAFHRKRGALMTMLLSPPGQPERGDRDHVPATAAPGVPGHGPCALHVPSGAPPRLPPARVAVSPDGDIVGFGVRADLSSELRTFGYTGLAVLSRSALACFPAGRRSDLLSVVEGIIQKHPCSVAGFDVSSTGEPYVWGTTGTPEGFLDIHRRILSEKAVFDPLLKSSSLPLHVCEGARIDPDARWKGFLEVGKNAVVEGHAYLEECVILEEGIVRRGSRLRQAIVYSGGVIETVLGEDR